MIHLNFATQQHRVFISDSSIKVANMETLASQSSHQSPPPKLVPLAPAPGLGPNGSQPQATMPYTCLICARRKIKCDKLTPTCSSCRKGKLECVYQAPPPRRRKRKLSGDVHDQLARYERILRENNLLPSEDGSPPAKEESKDSFNFRFLESETARLGKLFIDDEGKSRYVDSNFWRNIGDDEIPNLEDEIDNDQEDAGDSGMCSLDPLTAALMGSTLDLTDYHPSAQEAETLWMAHTENVEPLCKILHIPSTGAMVRRVSAQPQSATKVEECLLFAIYHFAVFSMTDEHCMHLLNESRDALLQRYQFAAKQALVNANFLKLTEVSVLQAFTLYLMVIRFSHDPHVFWVLTGVGVRLALRMGLHRDGEQLGLPPFEVQMRRRLFFQLVPLDGAASQMSGTGVAIMPNTWDTQTPLNLNDSQIWPGMTTTPEEQRGATDMIFCLVRASLGLFFARTGTMGHGLGLEIKDYKDVEPMIKEAEREVEEKYLRYCDIIDPLHFLTMGLARAAINAMRIRVRLPKVRNNTATHVEKQEILQFALKILDTDASAYTNGSLKKYLWHAKSFFAWGSWDSLIFILTTLRRADTFSPVEVDAAWQRIQQAYINHGDLLGFRRSIQNVAIARLVLKAWDSSPPSNSNPEPPFITSLRAMRKVNTKKQAMGVNEDALTSAPTMDTSSSDPSPPSNMDADFAALAGDFALDGGNDFDVDSTDWVFWEKLIKDYQS